MTENKTYEEITPEERDARNREAFTWEDGDVVITSTGTGGAGTEEELDAWMDELAKEVPL